MRRPAAAALVALILLPLSVPAAAGPAPAAEPFPRIPLEPAARRGHAWSYLTLASGAALIGASFALSHRGDQTYAAYLASSDPTEIQALYDRTARYDHLSQASLLGGELLIATGLYFRFVHRPAPRRLRVSLLPGRCAVSYRF